MSAKLLWSEEIIYQVFLDLWVWEVELVLHDSGREPELKLWTLSAVLVSVCSLRISHGGFFPRREVIFNNKGLNDERSPVDNNWKEVFTFLLPVTDVMVHNSPLLAEDSTFVTGQTAVLMMVGKLEGKMMMIK